jgi:hypothetical protein
MTAQEHILSELQKLAEPVSVESINPASLEAAILAKVMSKKFRKLKADDDTITIAQKAIKLAVENSRPIAINVIFGGNKLWRLDEAPEIDWAELFATMYFARWLKSIASVYQPGARLELYSEDVVLENMNNLPRTETDRYSETFIAMLEWLKMYLPSNVSFSYRRYADEYSDIDDYYAELEVAKKKVLAELGGKLPVLNEAQRYATELNVRLNPGQADDPEWREKAELIHQSIERTPTMERYINDPQYIPACPTYFPGCIAIGSTKKSYAKFWVGVGALEMSDKGYSEVVLTPKQLEAAKFEWRGVHIEGLKGKNFNKIRILAK